MTSEEKMLREKSVQDPRRARVAAVWLLFRLHRRGALGRRAEVTGLEVMRVLEVSCLGAAEPRFTPCVGGGVRGQGHDRCERVELGSPARMG